jgi:hypothetical protein
VLDFLYLKGANEMNSNQLARELSANMKLAMLKAEEGGDITEMLEDITATSRKLNDARLIEAAEAAMADTNLELVSVKLIERSSEGRRYGPRRRMLLMGSWDSEVDDAFGLNGPGIDDKTWNRRQRRQMKAIRALFPLIIAKAHEAGLYLWEPDAKISFSRKAGCSCGCSPGWIMHTTQKGDIQAEVTRPWKEHYISFEVKVTE